MKSQLHVYTCDRCGDQVTQPRAISPDGWGQARVSFPDPEEDAMFRDLGYDLCPSCLDVVRTILGPKV